MDAPTVRYAKTSDGVSIAYGVSGHGAPLLYCRPPIAPPFNTVVSVPGFDSWFGQLARERQLITFDFRNGGLSARSEDPLMSEAFSRDIIAILDDLGHESVDLFAELYSCPAAIRASAAGGGRVRRLALWHPVTGNISQLANPDQWLRWEQTFESARTDWKMFALRILSESFDLPGSEVRKLTEAWNRTTKPGDFIEAWDPRSEDNVDSLLADISVPTLVLHRAEDGYYRTLQDGAKVAAQIPGAGLAAIPGMANFPYTDHVDAVLEALNAFLDGSSPADVPAEAAVSAFQTIMFTDLESSTALTQRLGDAGAQDVLHGHNDAVRKSLTDHGGREVKHTGDGIMAAFPSAVRAVEAALQIQRDLAGGEVRVRIGLNAGEPIAEDDDFFGTAVQLAARICDRAEPGQILTSRVVADLCAGKQLSFQSAGEAHMKGFDEPVALYEVVG